jgi:hypothetical protein
MDNHRVQEGKAPMPTLNSGSIGLGRKEQWIGKWWKKIEIDQHQHIHFKVKTMLSVFFLILVDT